MGISLFVFFFFFNDTATTEIYTLSLHDALPIYIVADRVTGEAGERRDPIRHVAGADRAQREQIVKREREITGRSEEHTSELQSQSNLVCRLLLEKKKQEYCSLNSTRVMQYELAP